MHSWWAQSCLGLKPVYRTPNILVTMADFGNLDDVASLLGSEGSTVGDTSDPKTSFRMLAKMFTGQRVFLGSDQIKELHHDMKLVKDIVNHLVCNRDMIVKAHIAVIQNSCLVPKRKSINDRTIGETWDADIKNFGDLPPAWLFGVFPLFIGDGAPQAMTDDTLAILCKKGPKVMKCIREYLTGTQ